MKQLMLFILGFLFIQAKTPDFTKMKHLYLFKSKNYVCHPAENVEGVNMRPEEILKKHSSCFYVEKKNETKSFSINCSKDKTIHSSLVYSKSRDVCESIAKSLKKAFAKK